MLCKKKLFWLLLCFLLPLSLKSESFVEKKEALQKEAFCSQSNQYEAVHKKMEQLRLELKQIYKESESLLNPTNYNEPEIEKLLLKAKTCKESLKSCEQSFRQICSLQDNEELFSLMHEKEISLEQLILDYASSNYLYVIPSEMAKIELKLSSSLPIPKAAWEEIVELICAQNGIGIKPLNSFVKTLYWTLGSNASSLNFITHKPEELNLIESYQRVCFFIPLNSSEFQRVYQFLKRFMNERLTSMHPIGNNLVLVGEAQEIKELNKLIGFVRQHQDEKSYKLIPIDKMPTEDWQNILQACFSEVNEETGQLSNSTILVQPMQKYLLVLGSKNDLEKAEKIIADIHDQIKNTDQMSLYWYTCKYSEPQELASLLQRVYQMMVQQIGDEEIEKTIEQTPKATPNKATPCVDRSGTTPQICETAPKLVVNPPRASPPQSTKENTSSEFLPNFIVDAKSGMIIMVVKQCYLPKIRELAKKIDVAKKMVQIEVLLFEKRINDQTQFGLNLFNLGDQSNNTDAGVIWKVDKSNRNSPGILDYFFGRKKIPGVFPAFNFAYNFLISQDDIYVHSNPTITTVNQTPAVIDLIEEISVNMGTVENNITGVTSTTFIRAQYGTFIKITPTVNTADEEDDFQNYITLDTNITFDTTTSSVDNRPNINRRHIQNQVRIGDGETLILGGLRRKNTEDHVDKIPFLGDIPGLGKFFSFTSLNDKSTEMFIFITPRVVQDPFSEFNQKKLKDLTRRPGDTPELLKKLFEAKMLQKENDYRMSLKQLFTHG